MLNDGRRTKIPRNSLFFVLTPEGDGNNSMYSGQGGPVQRPLSRAVSARSDRSGLRSAAGSRRGSQSSLATWRSAFKSQRLPPAGLRKMRAAALGELDLWMNEYLYERIFSFSRKDSIFRMIWFLFRWFDS